MEKVKIIYFLELMASLVLAVAGSSQLNELMKLREYQRSRSFFDLGQRSLRFLFLNRCINVQVMARTNPYGRTHAQRTHAHTQN